MPFYTEQQIIDALLKHGNVSVVARRLKISRQAIHAWRERSQAVEDAYQKACVKPPAQTTPREHIPLKVAREQTAATTRVNLALQVDTWDAVKAEVARRGYDRGGNLLVDEFVRAALGLDPPDVTLPDSLEVTA